MSNPRRPRGLPIRGAWRRLLVFCQDARAPFDRPHSAELAIYKHLADRRRTDTQLVDLERSSRGEGDAASRSKMALAVCCSAARTDRRAARADLRLGTTGMPVASAARGPQRAPRRSALARPPRETAARRGRGPPADHEPVRRRPTPCRHRRAQPSDRSRRAFNAACLQPSSRRTRPRTAPRRAIGHADRGGGSDEVHCEHGEEPTSRLTDERADRLPTSRREHGVPKPISRAIVGSQVARK